MQKLDIKARREKAGVTQAAAAEAIGVSPRTWQRWEAGESRIPRSAAIAFAILVEAPAAAKRKGFDTTE